MNTSPGPVALITGGSAGLGLALTRSLAADGWHVITDGRDPAKLAGLHRTENASAIVGDIGDADHRADLVLAVAGRGRLDLLVHNASTLGPLPMRPLRDVTIDDLLATWRTNVGAPAVLTGQLADWLVASDGLLVGISSDAAVQHYQTWGPYGSSKAALDHVVQTYAAELGIGGYAFDPGDMRTQMHQDAFADEDISDRPGPETVVPSLRRLIELRPDNGRYRAADLAMAGEVR